MRVRLRPIFSASVALAFTAMLANASTITYFTPAGSTTSGPVDASATFTTSSNELMITLTDLEMNPTDVAQLISDLDFTLSTGATVGALTSSSGEEITVDSGGTFTLGSTVSTGWGVNNDIAGGIQLDALGYIGPAHLIIGPPGTGGTYSNANGSIAGNRPHNPFLNQTATFDLAISGIDSSTTITSATFSFGTTPGINVTGVVPEPSSYAFLMVALGALVWLAHHRKALALPNSFHSTPARARTEPLPGRTPPLARESLTATGPVTRFLERTPE